MQVKSVQCPKPESPINGNAVYTSYAYNSIVSYECKYGYTIVGAATRRCGADKKWTGKTPSCQEINCGLPGVLYNGWIENIESGALPGHTSEIAVKTVSFARDHAKSRFRNSVFSFFLISSQARAWA